MPTTTQSSRRRGLRRRMPATLRPSTNTSFGHLKPLSEPPIRMRRRSQRRRAASRAAGRGAPPGATISSALARGTDHVPAMTAAAGGLRGGCHQQTAGAPRKREIARDIVGRRGAGADAAAAFPARSPRALIMTSASRSKRRARRRAEPRFTAIASTPGVLIEQQRAGPRPRTWSLVAGRQRRRDLDQMAEAPAGSACSASSITFPKRSTRSRGRPSLLPR